MNPAAAFELTPEHDLATYGGTTHLRDGLHLSIHAALAEGEGMIVTDDPLIIRVLQDRHDLQQVPAPAGKLITSHQIEPTQAGQHPRDHDLPEIGEPAAVNLTRQHAERTAAQMRGDIPFDQPVNPNEFKKDELVAAAAQDVPVAPGDTKAAIADKLPAPPSAVGVTTPPAKS